MSVGKKLNLKNRKDVQVIRMELRNLRKQAREVVEGIGLLKKMSKVGKDENAEIKHG